MTKKDDSASDKTQPARRAVSRKPAEDVANVKTTPSRAAVKRRAPSVADVKTTASRPALKRRAPAAPHEPVIAALGNADRAWVLRRRELRDSHGDEAIGYVLKDAQGELCRFVVQGATLMGALVDSLRFELEEVFEWVRHDGAPLGHLTVTWKDAVLTDLDDRPLFAMETGPFAELNRMSFRLRPMDYPDAFTVFEGNWARPLFGVGRPRDTKAVPVERSGRTWAWVEPSFRDGLLAPRQDGLVLDSNASFPAAHRLWAATAMAASDYLVREYEARHSGDDDLFD